MKTNHLQAMIALNAATITNLGIFIANERDYALYCRDSGNTSLALHADSQVRKMRAKLAKAVTLQKAMHAELKMIYRDARCARKIAKVEQLRGSPVYINPDKTSHETETYLDAVLRALTPAKQDSRIAA